ncbi:hypothetical protein DASC09_031160 [Saccharomycopsis crataegensis]|uniref:Sphingoid long-chain base transporter RSB1 n=1 Tax=Saccharomycopsis crataegensis TaxID=43959 RepID=A0AAV5QMJ9_9ASCO|nr:hypothetical protein DASC09_031160 [Saccharomycopsis crataegensis]
MSSSTLTTALQSATASVVAAAANNSSSVESLDTYYGMIPSKGGNMAFAILFGIAVMAHIGLGIWYKQRWIGVAFFFGLGLEIIGYAARTKAHDVPNGQDEFLAQIICLTIAPCFVMAAYYYLLAKFVIIYGQRFSFFPPIYYSYLFITCDIVSLVLQAAGGGSAAISMENNQPTDSGTHIMVAGLAFQVATMTVFLFFWFYFFNNVYFVSSKEGDYSHHKLTIKNFFDTDYKDELFSPQYVEIRKSKLFKWFPFIVLLGTIAIYTRCIYRVIELAQGWNGFLITHENYVFVLDGMMILLAAYVLIPPFYPGFIFGRNTKVVVPKSLKLSSQRRGLNDDQQQINNNTKSALTEGSDSEVPEDV